VAYNTLWRYASHNNRLFNHNTDPKLVEFISRQYAFGPLLYLAATVVSAFSAPLGIMIYLALAVFFGLPNKEYRKLADAGR
jgi:uncharacterized membrane protein YdjX (TVP38/TMEM64 family)